MFYLNLLIKRRLAQISTNKLLDTEKLSRFGDVRTLFPAHHFKENQLSFTETKTVFDNGFDLLYKSPYREFRGTAFQQFMDGHIEILSAEGVKRRFSAKTTDIQDGIDKNQFVHVYGVVSDDNMPVAQVVVSSQMNALVEPYLSPAIRTEALKEILALSIQKQNILKKFLSDDAYASQMFEALCFVAFSVSEGTAVENQESLRRVLASYDKGNVTERMAEELISLLEIQDLEQMFCLELESCSEGEAHYNRPWIDYCAMWHCLRGCSDQSDFLTTTLIQRWNCCAPDLAAAASRFLTEQQLSKMVADLIRIHKTEEKSDIETFLYQLLLIDSPLDKDTLHSILETLFADSINSVHLGSLGKLKQSERHIEDIREWITNEFNRSYEAGNPKYVWIWSGLWMHDTDSNGENPLYLARTYLEQAPFSQIALVGMASLSLAAWSRRVGQGIPLREYKLQKFPGLLRVLYCHLTKPTLHFFKHAVSLCEDWMLNGHLERNFLNKRGIINACLAALNDPDFKESAETLLTLFDSSIDVSQTMKADYLDQLENAYKTQEPDSIIRKYRICVNTNCFQNRETEFSQFKRLIAALSKVEMNFNIKEELHPDTYCHFQYSAERLLQLYEEELTTTPRVGLDAFADTLPEAAFTEYKNICDDLVENPNAVYELKTAEEVSRFVSACRTVDQLYVDYKEKEQMLKTLAERSEITADLKASFLITSYFKVLCRYDLGEKALAYYLRNHEVLDRPYIFYSCRANHGCKHFVISDWNRFLSSRKRIEEAVAFAGSIGNDVVQKFKAAARNGMLDEPLATKILDLPPIMVSRIDDYDIKIRACSQWEHCYPKIGMAFSKFYDDLGIAAELLLKGTDDEKKALIDFGYSKNAGA